MPEIISKTVHVRFSTQQRATLADQMADIQSQIDEVEKEKTKAMAGFRASLKVLGARMHEFATAAGSNLESIPFASTIASYAICRAWAILSAPD